MSEWDTLPSCDAEVGYINYQGRIWPSFIKIIRSESLREGGPVSLCVRAESFYPLCRDVSKILYSLFRAS
jgi:hypothetical protein